MKSKNIYLNNKVDCEIYSYLLGALKKNNYNIQVITYKYVINVKDIRSLDNVVEERLLNGDEIYIASSNNGESYYIAVY